MAASARPERSSVIAAPGLSPSTLYLDTSRQSGKRSAGPICEHLDLFLGSSCPRNRAFVRGDGAKVEAAVMGQNLFVQVTAARNPAGAVATGSKARELRVACSSCPVSEIGSWCDSGCLVVPGGTLQVVLGARS